MTVDDLIAHPPLLHRGPGDVPTVYAVSPGVLRYLEGVLAPGQHTLETGAGVSTLLFAMKSTRHICVAPAPHVFGRIRDCLAEAGIADDGIAFVDACSEQYLPGLECGPLDLVLIDGRHAFPSPFIDWYYTAPLLKVGGLLLVDDIQIWTGQMLAQFLRESSEWEEVALVEARTAVFRKVAEGSHERFWHEQPFVARRSAGALPRVRAAAEALLHGRFREVRDMARRYRANRGSR